MQGEPYRQIPLRGSHGAVALVDLIDYDALSEHAWYRTGGRRTKYGRRYGFYASRFEVSGGSRRVVLMHRELLGLVKGDGLSVDHLNGDGLDNRRANLEAIGHAENMRRIHADTTSIPSMRHRVRMLEAQLAQARAVLAELEAGLDLPAVHNGRSNDAP